MNMFKYIRYIMLPAVLALVLISCYKDKGDYDYSDVNDVTIKDTTALSYTVLQFDTLTITPVVAAKMNTASLKYEWTARKRDPANPSGEYPVITLSNEATLRKQITLEPAVYRFIFKITDTTNNITSYLFYQVTVATTLSQGWMFVQQFATTGDISLLTPTGKMFHNIYERANGTALAKNVHTIDMNTTVSPKEVYILQGDSAVEVSPYSFAKTKSFSNWFFTPPTTIKPVRNIVYIPPTYYEQAGVFINNGLVHYKRYGGFTGAVLFGSEMVLDGTTNYSVSRQILIGDMNAARYIAAFYDTRGKRFIGLRGPAGSTIANLVHFPDSVAGTAFDANNVGMDLLFAGNTGQNYIYNSILKHPSGDCYLYRLNLNTATGAMAKQKMNAENVSNLTAAVSSLLLDYIYYSEANQVHMYEIGPNAATTIYSFPVGETVTAMTIESVVSTTTMMVATYDGAVGRVYQFKLDVNGKFTGDTYVKMYSDFGKIVQIKYKVQ